MHRIAEKTLDNGLRVVVAPLPHLHTVTATFSVRGGSRYERPEDNGLSHVVEHMIFRGTDLHPEPYELNRAIEDLGGAMDAATHVDFVQYQLDLPAASLEAGLPIFSRIFHAPRFSGFHIEKAILREELLGDLDEDGNDVDPDNLIRKLLFGDHPLGRTITGGLDRVEGFTEADLRRLHRDHYVGKNAALCIAGAVDVELGLSLAERCFSALPSGSPATAEPPPSSFLGARLEVVSNSDNQTDVRISFPTCHSPRGIPEGEAMAMRLLERILDDGLSSRLHRRICDELGLSYDVFAGLDAYEDIAALDLGATVAHDKVPTIVEAMLALVADLGAKGVSEEELERARRRHRWDLDALLDEAAEVSSYYAHRRLFDHPGTLASLASLASEVKTEDVTKMAATWLTRGQAHVACVGRVGEKAQRAIRKSLGLDDRGARPS